VAFQCLDVFRLILISLGFWSLWARLLRLVQNVSLMARVFGFPNMYVFFFGRALSMATSLVLIFQIRGLLPFSGAFRMIIPLSSSRSVHCSFVASPERIAVSLSSWS